MQASQLLYLPGLHREPQHGAINLPIVTYRAGASAQLKIYLGKESELSFECWLNFLRKMVFGKK
jgi:hypothetical protein